VAGVLNCVADSLTSMPNQCENDNAMAPQGHFCEIK